MRGADGDDWTVHGEWKGEHWERGGCGGVSAQGPTPFIEGEREGSERWGELGHLPSMASGGVRGADGAPEEPLRRRVGGPPRGTGGRVGQHRHTETVVQAAHAVRFQNGQCAYN